MTRLATAKTPRIGMIVPPAEGHVPPEPLALFPDLDFLATGLGLTELSPSGFDQVINRVTDCAQSLAERGADVISLMGTSLSFYRGPDFNADLVETITQATGLPATTMTNSVLEAIDHLNGARIAVATAYTRALNTPLLRYLEASGLSVESLESLNISRVEDIFEVTDEDLISLCEKASRAAPQADVLFLSCGGLQTAYVTETLEARSGLPVVSSAMAGAWGAVRLANRPTRLAGYGQLFWN